MYCNYFGFSEKPFDVTPDTRFLYLTSAHRETLASLIYGIRERRGFITIVGEVGTGKTTLLKAALDRLDDKTKIAFIFNTDMPFDQILNMALYELGLLEKEGHLSKANAIQRLNDFAIRQLTKDGNVVLILDEAHILSRNAMENLRLLSNLETQRHKLVQIVLSGQPELDAKLDQHELRQLAQRINLRRHIHPLDKNSTFDYLRHRLNLVTNSDSSPFNAKARQMIWEYSGGIPRKINMICDNAFLIGYGLKQKNINAAIIKEAAEDLKWDRISKTKPSLIYFPVEIAGKSVEMKPARHLFKLTATMVIVGIIALSGNIFLNSKKFQFSTLINYFKGVKDTEIEAIHQEQAKKQVQMLPPGIDGHAVLDSEIAEQKVPKKNIESETRTKNEDVSFLTAHRYPLEKDKSSDFGFQDIETENRENPPDFGLLKETSQNETETPQDIPSGNLPENNGMQTYKTNHRGPKSDGNEEITEADTSGVSNGSPGMSFEKEPLKEMTLSTTEPMDIVSSNFTQGVHGTVPKTENTPDKIQTAATNPVQVNSTPKTPNALKNIKIEKDESDASFGSLDKQTTIFTAIPLVNSPNDKVHPLNDLSGEDKAMSGNKAQPDLALTEEKKVVPGVNEENASLEEVASLSVPAGDSKIADNAGFDNSNLYARLRAFLNEYCITYEQKDLDKLSTFFALNAVEMGKPFRSWLSKYRQNFDRLDSIEYDIELKGYATEEALGLVKIDGIFHVRAKLTGSKEWRKNSGQISMVLEAYGNSFKVKQLDY